MLARAAVTALSAFDDAHDTLGDCGVGGGRSREPWWEMRPETGVLLPVLPASPSDAGLNDTDRKLPRERSGCRAARDLAARLGSSASSGGTGGVAERAECAAA